MFVVLNINQVWSQRNARHWFKDHVVGKNVSKNAAFVKKLNWNPIIQLEDLAVRLTSTDPDPRLDYIIVRAWPDAPRANIDQWPQEYENKDEREIAQWLTPPNRTVPALRSFLHSLHDKGGALVVRELERLPLIKEAIHRAIKKTGRRLWNHDRIHFFKTVQPQTGSYGWHYDLSDNILFSLGGQKRFRVATRSPHSETQLDVNLTKHDLLYIPRKLFHNGCGLDGGSILVSIALRPHRPSDFTYLKFRRLRKRFRAQFFNVLSPFSSFPKTDL